MPGALAALRGEHIAVIVPGADEALGAPRGARRCCARSTTAMPGFAVVVGRSRVAVDPMDLHRAAGEALLAANVAVARRRDPSRALLSFEDTGAYRLLLPAMSDDPAELERFYSDTIAPLVAYDEQYGTELVDDARDASSPTTARWPPPTSSSSPTATRSATGSSA